MSVPQFLSRQRFAVEYVHTNMKTRVGDHATNIAEDAVYAAVAEDIRHRVQPK